MKARDGYVAKLAVRLDEWSAEAARRETRAKATKENPRTCFEKFSVPKSKA